MTQLLKWLMMVLSVTLSPLVPKAPPVPFVTVPDVTTTSTSVPVVENVSPTTTVYVPPASSSTTSLPAVVPASSIGTGAVEGVIPDDLIGCIAYYESRNGLIDTNIFQFTSGTWKAYGGTGDPADASIAEQIKRFWLAWNDDGKHHWAAQKGRCF